MHSVRLPDLVDRLHPTDRLKTHFRLERRRVTLALRFAHLSYPSRLGAKLNSCPVFGVHFILLPRHAEQVSIANYLDVEVPKLDRLMAKIETAIDRLQEYRTALITAAVTGKIDVRGDGRMSTPFYIESLEEYLTNGSQRATRRKEVLPRPNQTRFGQATSSSRRLGAMGICWTSPYSSATSLSARCSMCSAIT